MPFDPKLLPGLASFLSLNKTGRAIAIAMGTMVMLATSLDAQTASDRRFVATVFATIAQAVRPGQLPPVTDCATHPGAVARLCEGIITTRVAEFTTNAVAAARARDLLEGVVAEQPDWPTAWYALGVARIQAARAGLSLRKGPLQPEGVPYSTGAESALIRAIELDSTFVLAAEALALASVRTDSTSRLTDRVGTLRYVRKLLPPPALYGEALVERAADHPDTAVVLWRQLLQRGGVPRGLVELQLARDLFKTGHADSGRAHLLAGASDSAGLSRRAYRQQLEWVATWSELAQWDSMPATTRSTWLRDFWALRDIRDGQPDGARLREHYARLDSAYEVFRYIFPSTPRLQLAKLNSQPCSTRACTEHTTITALADDHLDEVAATLGVRRPFEAFQSVEYRIDDRGLVYIRQGMPWAAMRTIDNGGFELWMYDRAGTPLYLSFSPHLPPKRPVYNEPYDVRDVLRLGDPPGESAPAMLIPSVAQSRGVRGGYLHSGFCSMKLSLCRALDPEDTRPNPRINCSTEGPQFAFDWLGRTEGQMSSHVLASRVAALSTSGIPRDGPYIAARDSEEGIWSDSIATNFDAFPLPFVRLLSPTVELHALDRASGGAPRLVIAFAIPASQMSRDSSTVNRATTTHAVQLHVAAYRRSDGQRIDFDTTGQFGPARALVKDESLTGVVEAPISPGEYTVSVGFTLDDSSGAVVHRDSVVVSGDEPVLRVSDLVLSRTGSTVQWNSGATVVGLNPLTTYPKGSEAQAYLQISGMVPGKSYETSFEILRIDADSAKSRPVTIKFTQSAAAARAEVVRAIGLRNLDAGKYRVRATVRGGGTEASGSGCLAIVK